MENVEILERERHYCETKTSRSNYPKLKVFFFHRVKLVPKNERPYSDIKFVRFISYLVEITNKKKSVGRIRLTYGIVHNYFYFNLFILY